MVVTVMKITELLDGAHSITWDTGIAAEQLADLLHESESTAYQLSRQANLTDEEFRYLEIHSKLRSALVQLEDAAAFLNSITHAWRELVLPTGFQFFPQQWDVRPKGLS